MPVRDGAKYLRASIDSIIGQTWKDFEFIIVDDGSGDETPAILEDYAIRDPRVRILRQGRDGLVAALNRGIAAARAPLIARHDADDIAMPQRLERQAEIMQATPALGLLGGHAEVIDEFDRTTGRFQPHTDHDRLVAVMRRSNPMIHSSTVFRTQLAQDVGGYRAPFEAAEDYDLWLRMTERAKVANLPEVLLRYRIHTMGASIRFGTRSAFSVRLAKRSAAMRRSGLPDAANELSAPPDWCHPPADAFYAQDARDFCLLEFANPDTARSLGFDHLDPATLAGLPGRLDHRERKIAQRAILNLLERRDRPAGFDGRRLWSLYFCLHPLRAVRIAIKERRFPGMVRPTGAGMPGVT